MASYSFSCRRSSIPLLTILGLETKKSEKGIRTVAWRKDYNRLNVCRNVAIPLMIRQARKRHGMSQNQLAKRLKMSVQQLQKLETPGKSNPTVKTLAAISQALDEDLDIRLVA